MTMDHPRSGDRDESANAAAGPSRHSLASYPVLDVQAWAEQVALRTAGMQGSGNSPSEASAENGEMWSEHGDGEEEVHAETTGDETPMEQESSMPAEWVLQMLSELAEEQEAVGMEVWCTGAGVKIAVAKAKEDRQDQWRSVKRLRSICRAEVEKKQLKKHRHRSKKLLIKPYWHLRRMTNRGKALKLRRITLGPSKIPLHRWSKRLLSRLNALDDTEYKAEGTPSTASEHSETILTDVTQEAVITPVQIVRAIKPSTPNRKRRAGAAVFTPKKPTEKVELKLSPEVANVPSSPLQMMTQGGPAEERGRSAAEALRVIGAGLLVGAAVTLKVYNG